MTEYVGWDGTLFNCFQDCETCVYGYYCQPCLFGQNAHQIDGSNYWFMCTLYCLLNPCLLSWIPQCLKRTILREKYGLRADPNCPDCAAAFFCGSCAICQEARFLKHRATKPDSFGSVIVRDPLPLIRQPGTSQQSY